MHVADDLRPYTCIVPNCKTPYVLFATEKKWKTHMFEEHRTLWYWRCFDCGKGENDGVPFDNENAFIEHTKTKHLHRPGIRSYEFRIKAEMSRRPEIVGIKSCPLCNWSEGKGKEDKPVNQKALLDHIAQDLHPFSLCAFPVAGDDGWQRNIERESLSVDRVDEWCADNLARCSLEKELSGYRQTLRNISGHF